MSKIDAEEVTGIITLGAIVVCSISLITLHLLPTGLSPLRNPVSQYGITRYRVGYRIQTIGTGIAAIAAAIGIEVVDTQGATLVVILLLVFGAARLAISWFPMDAPGGEHTETGRRHGLLAIVAFGCAAVGAIRLGDMLESAHLWGSASTAITAMGIVMIASLLAMSAVRRSEAMRGYFGLLERVFYAGAIVFLVLTGLNLAIGH